MVSKCASFILLNCNMNTPYKSADVGEVTISIYQGIQPQALQLVGGILPCHGGGGPVYHKILFDWNWGMDTLYLLRDIHEDLLVSRVSLLQPSLAFHSSHLGNTCLQPFPGFGQVMKGLFFCTSKQIWTSVIPQSCV